MTAGRASASALGLDPGEPGSAPGRPANRTGWPKGRPQPFEAIATTPGGRLRRARVAAGYTQAYVGAKLGVPESRVWSWEAGRAEPSMAFLRDLCELLHVSADTIIGVVA